MLPVNEIICGDNVEIMRQWPVECIDLIITSPPYNLGVTTGGEFPNGNNIGKWGVQKLRNGKGSKLGTCALANGYNSHADAMPPDQYKKWQQEFLLESWRLIKPTGAIFYNHKPRVQNGILQMPTDLNPGLPIRQIIIWKRSGGVNFSTGHYLPVHEWIIIFAKPDFRLKNQGASGVGDVWEITQESNNPHPAPFPLELPARIIETTNCKIVLDPYMGSGTTAEAAVRAGIDYVGIDNSLEYCNIARRRVSNVERELRGEWRERTSTPADLAGLPLFEVRENV